jgi:DNA-binding CsgD family transcriptional regulator
VTTIDELTPRQLAVLRCAAAGLDSATTALELGVSYETVKSHRSWVLTRLGARNITHAVHLAHERGLIA